MSDWPELSIDALKASSKNAIAMGPFGSRIKAENFVEAGVPVIKGGNLNGDFILEDKFSFLTEEKATELKTSNAFRRDIVITHRGTIGQVGIIPDDSKFERYVVSQSQLKITLDQDKVNPYFIYYFLRSPLGQHRLLMNASQVGVPAIAQASTSVKGIMVPCPDKDIQDEIVEMLLNLDHKIELNRQTNQTLEHIAQAIFKSWFVDFEPTRAKIAAKQTGQDPERAAMAVISGKTLDELDQLNPEQQEQLKTTAALFPDALVDSELGEIPEGWGIKDLKTLSYKISKGTTPRKADMQKAEDIEIIPFLKVRDISDDGEITRAGLDKVPESIHSGVLKRSMLETNDLLFSIAGTIGRVALVEEDLSNSNCNQAVAFVRLEEPEKYLELCRLNLVGSRVQDEVVSKVVQGVQANFSLTGLGEIKILIPTGELLSNFNKAVGDTGNKQRLLLSENRRLAELRDTLLPKLLSGELSESNTEPQCERVTA